MAAFGAFLASSHTAAGARAEGKRLERMQASPQWKDGVFGNALARVDGDYGTMIDKMLSKAHAAPATTPKITPRTKSDFDVAPTSGLRVTWLGHSTLIVEIDGQRVLVDPVWAERASPVQWMGPSRWYPSPLPVDELPRIDAVVISHDHYDHLDHTTVQKLAGQGIRWLVPLGIGAHLEYWGVPTKDITEMDWWETTTLAGKTRDDNVVITCTPARHFSGRSPLLDDQNATLWAGWAMTGPQHRVFYSGDTAMHPEFKTIGDKLGPFDVTLMENGAYDALWSDVHLGPEQAVIAHQLVRGKTMLPVHWGLFDLANHSWTEPVQRVLVAAEKVGVDLLLVRPGGWVEPDDGKFIDKWWDDKVPWQTVAEGPAWSTSVDSLLQTSPLYVASKAQGSQP